MRVLHLGKFPARHFGGIETHVKALTEGLAADGVAVTNLVYDLGRTAGGTIRTVEHGVRIVAVPCWGTLASLAVAPGTFATVRQLATEEPFDIVHAHFPDPLGFASLPFAGDAGRVASWHSDIVRQQMLGKLYGVVARRLFDPLDAVAGATPSHLASEQMKAFRPRLHRVVPYGVDPARFAPNDDIVRKAAALRSATGDRPVVFALGRHVYYKGFEVLIDAMREVDATLLLGGEGPLTPSLRQRAQRAGGRGDVRFVGRIEETDLPAYYHACDIFCLPSLAPSEAFGLVQLEAMGCGRPVVNCRLDNAVNFVAPDGVCAVTVEPGNAPALAQALQRLLSAPTLGTALGAAGRERVVTHFSIDAMIAATRAMYEDVLASRLRRTPA